MKTKLKILLAASLALLLTGCAQPPIETHEPHQYYSTGGQYHCACFIDNLFNIQFYRQTGNYYDHLRFYSYHDIPTTGFCRIALRDNIEHDIVFNIDAEEISFDDISKKYSGFARHYSNYLDEDNLQKGYHYVWYTFELPEEDYVNVDVYEKR